MKCQLTFALSPILLLLSLIWCFTITETAWGNWANWSRCNKTCDTGYQHRNRSCSTTSCIGARMQTRKCNTQYCPDHCYHALDDQRNQTCCHFPNTIFRGNSLVHHNACLPTGKGNCTFQCPLNRDATQFGTCINSTVYRPWSPWSNCSHRCFTGIQRRSRLYINVSYSENVTEMVHNMSQSRYCNIHPCQVTNKTLALNTTSGQTATCYFDLNKREEIFRDCITDNDGNFICHLDRFGLYNGTCLAIDGNYSTWTSWSACDQPSFGGRQNRTRACDNPKPKYGGVCQGHSFETQYCNRQSNLDRSTCVNATDYITNYTDCCMFNIRMENNEIHHNCTYNETLSSYTCPFDRFGSRYGICHPINGNLSEWSVWSNCSHNCFTGTRMRFRHCTNPPAFYDGVCIGNTSEWEYCNKQPCYDLSNCTSATLNGVQRCCALGIRLNGTGEVHDDCQKVNNEWRCVLDRFRIESAICDKIDSQMTSWSSWTNCTKRSSCGETYHERNRTCIPPKYGGSACNMSTFQEERCNMTNCPPDTYWSVWANSATCSRTCGNGTTVRTRVCLDINTHQHKQDSECVGDAKEPTNCTLRQYCPGFLMGRPGQNCTNACSAIGLACWPNWPKVHQLTDLRAEIEKKGFTCQQTEPKWKRAWHPAYFSNESKCVGFEDVSESSCKNIEDLGANITRLCHCIYKEDLVYTEWSQWSQCSRICGTAYKVRSRSCASSNQAQCTDLTQKSACSLPTCPDDLGYSAWSPWSSCSKNCNGGLSTRQRVCTEPDLCLGHDKESQMCNKDPCRVDGGWTQWSGWSRCSKSCGNGLSTKSRSCSNPAPLNSGADCNRTEAGDTVNKSCNTFHCSGYYLSYNFTQCNQTCLRKSLLCMPFFDTENTTAIFQDIGINCSTSPSSEYWQEQYHPSFNSDTKECIGYKNVQNAELSCNDVPNIPANVVRLCNCQNESDIGYGEWSNWGECSVTCGMGQKTRYRTCSKLCAGTNIDVAPCQITPCPINGGWSNFTDWTPCSVTCGGGMRYRYRFCNNPEPKHLGLPCDGNSQKSEGCNFEICPVHGMWGSWSDWTLCNKPCNNGISKRVRYCDSPKPLYGGRSCIGGSTLEKQCNPHSCRPVSVGIGVTFYNETFTNDLNNKSSQYFKSFEQKVDRNVRALYQSNESHVISVEIHWLSNGSVVANFSVNYTEITRFELIALLTSLQENRKLSTMPIAAFEIKTDEIPSAPGSVICKALSESSLSVILSNFSQTVKQFVVTGYSITYRKTADTSDSAWRTHVISNRTMNATLTYLEPFTLYTIRATAVTTDATGIPSDLEYVSTLEGVPSQPPSNATCRVTSPTTIYCEWLAVPYHAQKGIITNYNVKYRIYNDPNNLIESSNSWTKVSGLDSLTLNAVISSLKPYKRYEIKISASTKVGEGAEKWITLQTDEDAPSSPPLNITSSSFISSSYVDFFWNDIPADSWNGDPVALKLSYTITRIGSKTIIGGKQTTVTLNSDRRRYRVSGLKANWQISMTIRGTTAAGDGVASRPVVADTCLCSKNLYASWYSSNPYISAKGKEVIGIFPEFYSSMISSICGTCQAYSKTTVYFDRTKSGHPAKRMSESELKSSVSDDTHFHGPISGKKHVTIFEGKYQYVNLIDSTASVFVVVDKSKTSKTGEMIRSIGRCWPILVVCVCMTALAGILIWMADQFTNPNEMPTGKFLHGALQGFWWAFVSMTTVGYGDISPRGHLARSIAIVWTAVGLIVNGILVSSLSTALTVVTVNEQTMLYGANVSAVFNSPEYYLGLRRNAKMNSTGRLFMTSREALDALVNRQVQGTLLEFNEAANLQSVMSANSLKISKKIDSTAGIGFVLSDSMANFHSQIRSYVTNNYNLIQALIKNYTKEVNVPVVASNSGTVSGLFDAKSAEFKDFLINIVIGLGVAMMLGLVWNYILKVYILRRNRVRPAKSQNEVIQDNYNVISEELLYIVDEFVSNLAEVEQLSNKQGLDRFRLLRKHFETMPFGLPMWLRYGTTDNNFILAKIRIEETFLENLNKNKQKRKKQDSTPMKPNSYETLHLSDIMT